MRFCEQAAEGQSTANAEKYKQISTGKKIKILPTYTDEMSFKQTTVIQQWDFWLIIYGLGCCNYLQVSPVLLFSYKFWIVIPKPA